MLREDAEKIMAAALKASLPDEALRKALAHMPETEGRLYLAAVGKAGWQMASEALRLLDDRICGGAVVTKYGHSRGPLPPLEIIEAGHPIPDENSCRGAECVLNLAEGLREGDRLLFLLSGGGSALFEQPLIELEELKDINRQLLACGAEINEINCLRKRFSAVKGGRLAEACAPAQVYTLILSDVLGEDMGMVSSGPACPDRKTSAEARAIAEKYSLRLSDRARRLLDIETPKRLDNAENILIGSVSMLCRAAAEEAERLGYRTLMLTDSLCCEAKEAGSFLGSCSAYYSRRGEKLAIIAGGETVVHLHGRGLGGRNQELALAAAKGIEGLDNVLIFSLGSDGTDGPTDAAGGITDGSTAQKLRSLGLDIDYVLEENDSYNALEKVGGLIITGPTGTNVDDISVALIN